MNLDTAFIAQVITIIGFAVGVSVLLASMKYPSHIRRSLRSYSYGKFLMGAGFLLVASRGATTPELLIPAANGLAVAGLSMNYVAVRHLQDKPVAPLFPVFAGALVWSGCLIVLLIGPPDLSSVRLLSSVAATLVLLLIAAEMLLFYEGRGIAHYLSGALVLVLAGAYAIRIGAALNQPASPLDTLVNDGTERIVFIMTFLGTVVGTINFILMASDEFNKELTLLAHTDGLTGVLNRRRFLELGETEFRRARCYGRPLTVLIIDIDRFKAINDQAGHPFGDRVIRAVADCCVAQIHQSDAIGRLGGEEFAVLLPETALESAERMAERLREAIEHDLAPLAAERALTVTCSVGGVTIDVEHASFSELIEQSDAALYAAKRAGRNRVHFAKPRGGAEPRGTAPLRPDAGHRSVLAPP